MKKADIKMAMHTLNESALALEEALRYAKQIFEMEECPEPHEHWDEMAELAGSTAGEVNCGDVGKNIDDIYAQLDALAEGAKE